MRVVYGTAGALLFMYAVSVYMCSGNRKCSTLTIHRYYQLVVLLLTVTISFGYATR